MYHILLELPTAPQPNDHPLTIEEGLNHGQWRVSGRTGVELGTGYAVKLGATSIGRADVMTTVERVDD